ncbi:MAG: hypothetical protein K0R54_221 [Clostridiaceae bacterium]|jgi:hypothetical protein|nr:hypothetical protein [Clostridiaceae bacterium]
MKTEETKKLEKDIWFTTHKIGVYGCFEVTICANDSTERVDYMTFDTKNIWRCYEIKVSKHDFYSNAKKTFLGHYNYYVLTKELYEQIKDEIPHNIGVYVGKKCVKKAKKQVLGIDEEILKKSMIRSLYRYFVKDVESNSVSTIENLKRQLSQCRNQKDKYYHDYWNLRREVESLYGTRWDKK